MKITVKLFGDLKRHFPEYDPQQGLHIDIPDGATSAELLTLLGIDTSPGVTAIMDGRVLRPEDIVSPALPVNILPVMYGG
jgi:sulfur carrier protein ThiS